MGKKIIQYCIAPMEEPGQIGLQKSEIDDSGTVEKQANQILDFRSTNLDCAVRAAVEFCPGIAPDDVRAIMQGYLSQLLQPREGCENGTRQ